MTSLRRLLLDRRRLVVLLATIALAVKLLVPTGFMIGVVDGHAVLQVCNGVMPIQPEPTAHMHHGTPAQDDRHRPAAETACPYAALAQAAVTPIDPLVLAVALAFALALGVRQVDWPRAVPAPRLRPPSRGPPLPA